MQITRFLTFLSLLPILLSCNSDEYSPNQKFNRNSAVAVNNREISELRVKDIGAAIKIAVSGDTQRSYKEAEAFVEYINSRDDIDFVILNGDISDFGLLAEFDGVYKIYNRLKVPFISVIGNHDLVANGLDVYKRMFGDLNFTFSYAGIKFVCHDTNGREYDFNGSTPNMSWLRQNLKPGINERWTVAFSHVPPTDADFDPSLADAYQNIMNQTPGVIASVHSHQHSTQSIHYQNNQGIPFIITNAIVKRGFSILNIANGQLVAQEVSF